MTTITADRYRHHGGILPLLDKGRRGHEDHLGQIAMTEVWEDHPRAALGLLFPLLDLVDRRNALSALVRPG